MPLETIRTFSPAGAAVLTTLNIFRFPSAQPVRPWPQVEISTVEGSRARLFDGIQNGTIDIAIVTGEPASDSNRSIVVIDDWPGIVPITDAGLRVMESHFAEELDEILRPRA